jgi:ferredoxin-type protein NapG
MASKLTPKEKKARRKLLLSLLIGGGVTTFASIGYLPLYQKWVHLLRPPGALAEDDLLASCIKCGQCVQVCPVEAIKLSSGEAGFGIGVPFIDAREQACDFSCDATQCVLACPTGALSHNIDNKEQVNMGFARLSKPESCLARKDLGFKGQARGPDHPGTHRYSEIDRWNPIKIADHPYDLEQCDLCVRECPIKGAISMEPLSDYQPAEDKRRTPVVHDACVGCGMCEMICPLNDAAIVIDINREGPKV